MIWKVSRWSGKFPDDLKSVHQKVPNLGVHNFKSQIWDLYCKHCLWSIFGPCSCTTSCKTTFHAHLSRIWKLTWFTHFIRKVFATKILQSGKFLLFVTLHIYSCKLILLHNCISATSCISTSSSWCDWLRCNPPNHQHYPNLRLGTVY